MRLGTRLLLPLLAVVTAVMLLYAIWAIQQRESTVAAESRREAHAYAVALSLAMEAAFRDPARSDVQDIIDRISLERTVFAVIVYDAAGRPIYTSGPLAFGAAAPIDTVRRVLAGGEDAAVERDIDDQPVYSVLRPISDPSGQVVGAFEVAQPLSSLQIELARTRQRFVLNTLTLLLAVTFVILVLVRVLVGKPLERFVAAARALGRGELAHRIDAPARDGELADLASEFNRMAARIENAQLDLVRESEERVALERRLRETEKLAAVGNLAAGLAHEIGAPLHVIRGRAEMVLQKGPISDAERRNLGIIIQQIDRITVIVRNLLSYARRREPKIEDLNLAAVVGGAAELLENEFAKSDIAFEWHGPETLPVSGDRDQLHQVFVNLFLNAVHALDAASARRRIIVEATFDRARAQIVIEVRDSGPGIPADALPRIFDPYFTTKPGGQGTGLGLAVAHSIVEEHGGALAARTLGQADGPADTDATPGDDAEVPHSWQTPGSAPESGAVFRLTFPAVGAARTAAPLASG